MSYQSEEQTEQEVHRVMQQLCDDFNDMIEASPEQDPVILVQVWAAEKIARAMVLARQNRS
jgi:glutamate dehydrogenase/leucine dehydrogenase